MITKDFLSLTNLIIAQTLCIYELRKIFIIYKDRKLIIAVFELVPLGFKNFNNSKNLLLWVLDEVLTESFFLNSKLLVAT